MSARWTEPLKKLTENGEIATISLEALRFRMVILEGYLVYCCLPGSGGMSKGIKRLRKGLMLWEGGEMDG